MLSAKLAFFNARDDNGVELYRDRPEEEWPGPADGQGVAMTLRPLDLQALLAELDDR